MSELADAIREQRSSLVLEGLHLHVFPNRVINLSGRERELVQADIETIRVAIAEAGFEEIESWHARQGVSWLSEGMSAGVSFRLIKAPEETPPGTAVCRHCGWEGSSVGMNPETLCPFCRKTALRFSDK